MALETPRSQYRQLADLLRAAIEDEEYAPGSTLPSEPELARQYGVSRLTVNRAVQILRSEGFVRVNRGRGTVVRILPVLIRDAAARLAIRAAGQARGAFQAELELLGLTPRSDTEILEMVPPDDVASLLKTDGRVLARRRQMYANDVPVQIATSYLPLDIASGTQLTHPDTGPGGTYSRLADLGYGPAAFTETVRIRLANDHETRFLHLDTEQRIIAIRRLAHTDAGRVVEVSDTVLPAHQWELVYKWSAE